MSSSSKLKRQAKKAEKEKKTPVVESKEISKKPEEKLNNGNGIEEDFNLTEEEKLVKRLELDLDLNAKARAVTGVLGVSPKSRDIKIDNFSIMFHGFEILTDTKLELNCGRRYGLIGQNGCGKSTMLSAIGKREVPIQPAIDIYHLTREMPPSEKTALEAVMEVDNERIQLEKLAEELVSKEDEESQEQLMDIYERLDEIDADKAKAKVRIYFFCLKSINLLIFFLLGMLYFERFRF